MGMTLIIDGIGKRFGWFWAIRNVRAAIPAHRITAIVGPNGAGKSTLLNVIAGCLSPDEGRVLLDGMDITGLPPYKIARLGIGRQFQDVRVFREMTVTENVVVSLLKPRDQNALRALAWGARGGLASKRRVEEALRWLEQVGLEGQRDARAKELSFGQQKVLALTRLLAMGADFLLLDEPTAGLSPQMIDRVAALIRATVEKQGTTVAIVEHNMSVVTELAYWIHFLHEGKVAFSGKSEHVLGNRAVREIYMGF